MAMSDRATDAQPTRHDAPSGSYPAPPAPATRGRGYTVAGFIVAAIGLFLIPILLGPAGAVLGFIGYRKGDPKGMWAVVAGIVATAVGMALGFAVMQSQT